MFKPMMIVLCLSCPLLAQAEDPPRLPPPDSTAEAWLRVQASNQQASPKTQKQSATERELSLQRWLDSYKYPIPDAFRYQSMSTTGN
ncbi:MAG: DUF3613 domain-containing protein [Pseudomonas putida]|jgi:hypothetical protein|uniref:DUF3613 domain-containing protein n=1 Tax=Pseudomonas TaxID=286 RepID=UPI0018AC1B5E|nr:DUF3613 domain-containing protein [Pseudomonas guariconensis]MBF8731001.1 DUF3613 domain-containing protein [Pseudomonas guariconensis]MDR0212361.1 DUF3613 domain-containing protein [Pseudomonas putida]